jgi:oxygen-independent coproporphyrinogen-3 oxidase
VSRVSLGAQTFRPELLRVLERVAGPDDVRRAVHHLRDVGFDNISLDLIYGIPGQSASDLEADLDDALALEPEHLSCYELEAKPGTRFTHVWGEELGRQADAMEDYFERVVATLTGAGYRWYETANFCRAAGDADMEEERLSVSAPPVASDFREAAPPEGRDLRARHNLAYWLGRDYLGVGIGAVSTIESRRWRNTPKLGRYLEALAAGLAPEREHEPLDDGVKARERVMLGLRLDEPLPLAGIRHALDAAGLARVESLGLAEEAGDALSLTERGRFLGGAVTAELLA